jgi:DNA-binding NarL/FixJ family response regulator
MNLSYSILWFDDDKDFFDSLPKEPIETEIASWGFSPKIFPVHNATEFNQYTPFEKFDMIVVDFNLGNERGDKFIKDVRDQKVFTEIIFYSTSESSELWKAVHDHQLEGVFVTNKRGIEQKLLRVALQSVRKVLDLENMRGIVMSEVGDLDALLEEIFKRAMQGIAPEQQRNIFDRFHEKTSEQNKEFMGALSAFKEAPSIDGLLHLSDSDKRWQSFNRVKKHHNLLKNNRLTGDYQKDILSPRNFLAHGVPERKTDGSFLFRHKGKEYTFDDGVSQTLRKKILEYKSAFTEIAEILEPA